MFKYLMILALLVIGCSNQPTKPTNTQERSKSCDCSGIGAKPVTDNQN